MFVQMPEGPGGMATGQNDSRIRVHTNFQLATTNSLISITVLRLSLFQIGLKFSVLTLMTCIMTFKQYNMSN